MQSEFHHPVHVILQQLWISDGIRQRLQSWKMNVIDRINLTVRLALVMKGPLFKRQVLKSAWEFKKWLLVNQCAPRVMNETYQTCSWDRNKQERRKYPKEQRQRPYSNDHQVLSSLRRSGKSQPWKMKRNFDDKWPTDGKKWSLPVQGLLLLHCQLFPVPLGLFPQHLPWSSIG